MLGVHWCWGFPSLCMYLGLGLHASASLGLLFLSVTFVIAIAGI